MAKKTGQEIIVISDIHGEYRGFIELLNHSKAIDSSDNWKAKNKILIQMGDVIDRGSRSLQVYDLLDILQTQAKKHKSKVVRLLGNHELEILKRNEYLTTLPYHEVLLIRKKIVKDILAKKIIAAFYYKDKYVFTHAGIRDELINILAKEIAPVRLTPQRMVNKINDIFRTAVFKGDFSHPIFNISYRRGGESEFGGIFWEDLRDFASSKHGYKFKQIVSHTPINKVSVFNEGKTIAVDIGIFEGYGGGRSYLKIKSGKIKIVDLKTNL
jgi:hypothetical protein